MDEETAAAARQQRWRADSGRGKTRRQRWRTDGGGGQKQDCGRRRPDARTAVARCEDGGEARCEDGGAARSENGGGHK